MIKKLTLESSTAEAVDENNEDMSQLRDGS